MPPIRYDAGRVSTHIKPGATEQAQVAKKAAAPVKTADVTSTRELGEKRTQATEDLRNQQLDQGYTLYMALEARGGILAALEKGGQSASERTKMEGQVAQMDAAIETAKAGLLPETVKMTEATLATQTAIAQFGEGSPQAKAALESLTRSEQAFEPAVQAKVDSVIDPTGEFRRKLDGLDAPKTSDQAAAPEKLGSANPSKRVPQGKAEVSQEGAGVIATASSYFRETYKKSVGKEPSEEQVARYAQSAVNLNVKDLGPEMIVQLGSAVKMPEFELPQETPPVKMPAVAAHRMGGPQAF